MHTHTHTHTAGFKSHSRVPLPRAGLTLDPISGVISGTATELQARPEIYLVTATNEGEMVSWVVAREGFRSSARKGQMQGKASKGFFF